MRRKTKSLVYEAGSINLEKILVISETKIPTLDWLTLDFLLSENKMN